jgi:hypothetical protein
VMPIMEIQCIRGLLRRVWGRIEISISGKARAEEFRNLLGAPRMYLAPFRYSGPRSPNASHSTGLCYCAVISRGSAIFRSIFFQFWTFQTRSPERFYLPTKFMWP